MGNAGSCPEFDGRNVHTGKTDIDWMNGVSDDTPLSALSIPGTHQSVSYKWGPACVCQSWPLYEQFKRGIRFIDIRFRHIKNNLQVYHDKFDLGLELSDVLQDCFKFLEEYPSEVILMRLKKENTDKDNTESLNKTVTKKLVPTSKFYLTREDHLPKIKRVRGKIVLLKNFPGDKIGFPYSSSDIQDDWNVSSLMKNHMDRKWEGVEKHLNFATKGLNTDLFITYTSGASALAFPDGVARRINKRLYAFLLENKGKRARWGIIALDFPGADLVKYIVDSNFYL